jgi:hypothetical protein
MHNTSYFPKRCATDIWEEETRREEKQNRRDEKRRDKESRGEDDFADKVEKRSR